MVNNRAEAEAAAFAMRYPPRGGRSMGAFATDHLGFDNYIAQANDRVFLAGDDGPDPAHHSHRLAHPRHLGRHGSGHCPARTRQGLDRWHARKGVRAQSL